MNFGDVFMAFFLGMPLDKEEFDKFFDEYFVKYFQDNPNGYDEAMRLIDEQFPADSKDMIRERMNKIYEQSKKGGKMIATNIEQSKHLLELGLDPKTADMFWKYSASLGNTDINGKIAVSYHDNLFVGKYDGAIPAWSLTALLGVMPKVIVHDMDKHVLCFKYAEGVAPFMYYVVESGRNKGKLIRFDNGRCVPDAYDALDAAYTMVCWLLEQGLIKKGGNDE